MSLRLLDDSNTWMSYWTQTKNPSLYSTPGWLRVAAQIDNGYPQVAIFEDGLDFVLHPFIRRDIPNSPFTDLISGFDFGGFWFNTTSSKTISSLSEQFVSEFSDYCKHNGIISEFVRNHPWTIPLDGYSNIKVRDNVIVDLTQPIELIESQFHSSLRSDIRRMLQHNLTIKYTSFPEFHQLYLETTEDKGRDPYYLFSEDWLCELRNAGTLVHCFGAYTPDEDLCAAHVYIVDKDKVFYHLSAASPNFIHLKPNIAILWYIISQSHLGHTLHLGGGRPASLMKFKEKFSQRRIPYYVSSMVFNQPIYDALKPISEDFPVYRKAVS